MDYKMLIILLALLFIVIMTYRELTIMKHDLNNNVDVLIDSVKQETNLTVLKIQSSVTKCMTHVKDVNLENMKQLKKITMLNNQPIMRITNHYTETDESLHTDMRSNRYTEIDNTNQKNSLKNNNSIGDVYYMSDSETDQKRKKGGQKNDKLDDEPNNESNKSGNKSSIKSSIKSSVKSSDKSIVEYVDDQEMGSFIPTYNNTEKSQIYTHGIETVKNKCELSVEKSVGGNNPIDIINMLNNEEILYSAKNIENDDQLDNHSYMQKSIEEDIKSILTSDLNDILESDKQESQVEMVIDGDKS